MMMNFLSTIITQVLPFLPFALGISISFSILRATDMTMDGSFVLGAVVFARLVSLGISPYLAFVAAIIAGSFAGVLVATIQRGGRIDPLLAGVLATFILSSLNLIIMGRPNLSLLTQTTLVSSAFQQNESYGWGLIAIYSLSICTLAYAFLQSNFGLTLRAFGDNPQLLKRLGVNVESYRMYGFALTNALAAASGCLSAQAVGYADIGMGLGMTLTGIGAIILGQQILRRFSHYQFRIGMECGACVIGAVVYFLALNGLFHLDIDPIYLKMILGLVLIFFLRAAVKPKLVRGAA